MHITCDPEYYTMKTAAHCCIDSYNSRQFPTVPEIHGTVKLLWKNLGQLEGEKGRHIKISLIYGNFSKQSS